MKPRILIVDDEKPTRDAMARILSPRYDCLTAPDAEQALKTVVANPDLALLITDYRMEPGDNGVELMKKAKALNPNLGCILITAFGEIELAVGAMKEGADDFLTKPITDIDQLEVRVAKAIKTGELARQVETLQSRLGNELESFTGKSPAMERVYRLIRKVAPTNATVLIEGPSGSGKELTARALHDLSSRAKGPFVAVECAAFTPELLKSELFGYEPGTFTGGLKDGKAGCFEQADGGTLFLDEIGEIDAGTQTALLRTLETRAVRRLGGSQEKPVDFRLVAATNRNLTEMVAAGAFREDLYYRLNVIDIRTPALRDHREDVALLVARFLKEFAVANGSAVSGIEPAALKALEDYDWPGNVRQLRNVMEKMVVLATGPKLTVDDLPIEITERREAFKEESKGKVQGQGQDMGQAPERSEGFQSPAVNPQPSGATTLEAAEKRQILETLAACGGNKSKAALRLGISRRTLHRKLNEWKIDS